MHFVGQALRTSNPGVRLHWGCQQHQDYYRLASVCWKPLRCLFKDGAKSCAHICITLHTFATQRTLLAHFRSCLWASYGGRQYGSCYFVVSLLSFCLFFLFFFVFLSFCFLSFFLFVFLYLVFLSFCLLSLLWNGGNMGRVTLLSHCRELAALLSLQGLSSQNFCLKNFRLNIFHLKCCLKNSCFKYIRLKNSCLKNFTGFSLLCPCTIVLSVEVFQQVV